MYGTRCAVAPHPYKYERNGQGSGPYPLTYLGIFEGATVHVALVIADDALTWGKILCLCLARVIHEILLGGEDDTFSMCCTKATKSRYNSQSVYC